MTAEVVQQCAEVRTGVNDQEEDRVWRHSRHYGVSAFIFEDGGHERSATCGLSDLFGCRNNGGSERRQVFPVEVAVGTGVNQETISPQNHHGLDTFALREGPNEVVNGGQ
jgi:hypothetical protein